MPATTLHELLYGQPGRVVCGEYRGAFPDMEDRLRAADFGGHFVVRAQDEQEEATHFEWVGCVGGQGFQLEVVRCATDSWVTVHRVVPVVEMGEVMASRRGSPTLMGF